ncbi:MAG: tetratricopeptide repeat protein [Pseudanabaenaceae cyanobacterium bins.68]|nr:tetratricopeptide repeat protein [Pseudanabaenaceae cyanobacterium bins.68]
MESKLRLSTTTGRLLVFLGVLAHLLFTLLPDSSSLVVSYPWTLLWQSGLLVFVITALLLLWRRQIPFFLLGSQLDWGVGLFFSALCLATIFSPFAQNSLWYSLIGFAMIAVVYTLNNHLNHGDRVDRLMRLLNFQVWLSLVLVIESLGLWVFTTLLPELERINQLGQAGVAIAYDFSKIQLRNWAPFGHQNYTAGFLILALPLFVAWAILKPKQRIIWLGAIALTLIDLYTTSSRGGLLALVVLLGYAIAVVISRRVIAPAQALGAGLIGLSLIGTAVASNNRLQTLFVSLLSGGGELAFRQVMFETGESFASGHGLTGAGAGSVFLLFQQYRPPSASAISEWIFQLHITPVQIWAELGVWGIAAWLWVSFFSLRLVYQLHFNRTWRSHLQHQVLTYSLFGALLAYTILSFTDYQLDVFGISAMLMIIWLSLIRIAQIHQHQPLALTDQPLRQVLAAMISVYAIAALVWITPINRAWQLAATGFQALQVPNLELFKTSLIQAHQLTPWEPYYPLQLGYNLAEYGRRTGNRDWLTQGLTWLEQGIKVNPYQEFGYNYAGWLQLNLGNPQAAERHFRRALELVPHRLGLRFGLAISLLRQQQTQAAIAQLAAEFERHPHFATSPFWRSPQWQPIFQQAFARAKIANNPLLQWWFAPDLATSQKILAPLTDRSDQIQLLAQGISGKPPTRPNPTPLGLAIQAWHNPSQRQALLTRAWAIASQTPPDQNTAPLIKALVSRMANSANFDQWLRAPLEPNHPLTLRSRAIRQGFGVNSRKIDGAIPQDFWELQTNSLIYGFLQGLL